MTEQDAGAAAASPGAADDHLIRLPPIRRLVTHTSAHLIEAVIAPALTFYLVLRLVDLRWALVATLLWAYTVIGVRMTRRARVSGVLMLSAAVVTIRAAIAFAANSSFLYLLQPSLANFAVAVLFLASLVPHRPLTRRLADDFCLLPPSLDRRPRCTRFFARLTLLWAFVCAVNGAAQLILLLHNSVGGFLALRPVVSYGLVAVAITLSYALFRTTLRSEGLVIVFGQRPGPARRQLSR